MNGRTIAGFIGICALGFNGCGGRSVPLSGGHVDYLSASILNVLNLSTSHEASGINVQRSRAYISTIAIGSQSGSRSLVIADLETPTAPTVVSKTSSGLARDMAGIAVDGNYAYVPYESSSGPNFQVWNISNPSRPSVVGAATISCPTGMYPFSDPAVYGNYVYVSCWESEVTNTGTFAVVNVSNPTSPSVIASVPVTAGYQPISFAVSGYYLYVVATQGGSTSDHILLYSIVNPTSPSLLATVSTPHSPQSVAAQGAVAVVPIYDGTELQIIDFSNRSSPQAYLVSLGSCHPQRGTIYAGTVAFAPCDSPGGMAIVDLGKISSPSYLGTVLSGTVFNSLADSNAYLYGADTNGNLQTIGFER